MLSKKHFLIIGAGLSGLSVAIQLIRKGAQVTVVDNNENHSSRVAAAMINPLVFRRMTKGWRVDEFVPTLIEFYTSIEKETKTAFFQPIPIRRLFSTEHEAELWNKKQYDERFTDYMETIIESDKNYDKAINLFGSGRLKNTYSVDSNGFLESCKSIIERDGKILNDHFDYTSLTATIYDGVEYSDIIFCEGYLGIHNPWFSHLPLDPTKGEVLTIKSTKLPEDESLNRKCFNLPLGDKLFKVGSTIDWGNSTTHTTLEGRQEILKKLSLLIDENVEVIEQQAGVRPGSADRRPFIGTHPKNDNYHIFNGLGSKGYMLAPLLSLEFAQHLIEGTELHAEVQLSRYNKLLL